jgi:hypothetical protein
LQQRRKLAALGLAIGGYRINKIGGKLVLLKNKFIPRRQFLNCQLALLYAALRRAFPPGSLYSQFNPSPERGQRLPLGQGSAP